MAAPEAGPANQRHAADEARYQAFDSYPWAKDRIFVVSPICL